MLETKCIGDKYKMLVTVLAVLVTNIHFLQWRQAPIFKRFDTHRKKKILTNFESLTSRYYQNHCHRGLKSIRWKDRLNLTFLGQALVRQNTFYPFLSPYWQIDGKTYRFQFYTQLKFSMISMSFLVIFLIRTLIIGASWHESIWV